MPLVTHEEVHQLAAVGCNLGTLPSFAYVLCTHVLHRMAGSESRQIMLRIQDLYDVALRDANGRILAGNLRHLIHEGIGTPVVDIRVHISAHYIDALQKLHWAGLLYSDILESRLDQPGAEDTHFTMLPELREGSHWRESTPVVYRLPALELPQVVQRFASVMHPDVTAETEPRFEIASFL